MKQVFNKRIKFEKKKQVLSRKIKLIWDFKGPESEKIAEHHAIHLKEFAEKEKLSFYEAGIDRINDSYSIAFITVAEEFMIRYRDALRPHRGELAR